MSSVASPRGCLGVLAVFGLLIGAGCNPSQPKKPKSRTFDGEITRIDPAKRRVAMKLRNPKNKAEWLTKEVEGAVTETTEIQINGRAAKFADLRVKDTVEATGYRQGKDDNEEIIAEAIRVDRPTESIPSTPGLSTPPPSTTAASPPPPAANGNAPAASAPPRQSLSREELMRLFVQELEKARTKAILDRAELLKEGRPPDDIDVLALDGRIAKAEQAIAQAEDEAAKHGIVLRVAPGSTQPAATQP